MKTLGRTSPRGACAAAFILLCSLTAAGSPRTQTSATARQEKSGARSAASETPMSMSELLKSLDARGPKKSGELVKKLEARGVAFRLTPEDEARLSKAGATREVIDAARSNYRPAQQESERAASARGVVMPAAILLPFEQDPSDTPLIVPRPMPTPESSGGGGGYGSGSGYGRGGGVGYGPGRGDASGGYGPSDGGGKIDDSRTFRPNEVTRKAIITAKPEPGFTEKARKNNVVGTVRLRVVLSASGSVKDIHVVKSLPDGLTEKAIAAAKRIRFTPAQKDGRTVSQYATLDYNFNIY